MSDEIEDNQWQLDQIERGHKDVARMYASLYHGLTEQAVPEQAAILITVAHIRAGRSSGRED